MAQLEILIQGSTLRTNIGLLGACTIALVKGEKNVLIDTGHYGNRRVLLDNLKQRGLGVEDVDIVVLSHLHWDHALNIDLFPHSTVILNSRELDYARNLKPTDWATPTFIASLLEDMKVRTVNDNAAVIEGVKAIETPGHTVGHLSIIVKTPKGVAIVAQDAIPTARSFNRGLPDFIFWDEDAARKSVRKIKSVKADIIYPGHDRAFRVVDGRVEYVSHSSVKVLVRRETEENFAITLATEDAEKPERT